MSAVNTLCAGFQEQVAARPANSEALAMRGHPGLSWSEYARRVRTTAAGFAALGVTPGDRIAILTRPRPEFNVVDTALLFLRATPFSVQEGETVAKCVPLLEKAEAQILVTENHLLASARSIAQSASRPVLVVSMDGGAADGEMSLDDVEDMAAEALDLETLADQVQPEDIATLIFTAGTTGEPKAVQLSHRSIIASAHSTFAMAPSHITEGHVLSYLPLNHIAERFMSHYTSLVYGLTVHSVPDPDQLYEEIRRVRPTRFFGIPRVYEKLVDRIAEYLAANPEREADRQRLLAAVRAEQEGRRLDERDTQNAEKARASLAAVREFLGLDRAEYLGVATAPSAYAMLETLHSVGLRVSDIWGMSEVVMCTLNPPDAIRLGTVGRFLDGVEGRIADDGEIMVRGTHSFSGYLGDPERTAEICDHDGWIHTGDVGSIDDGYLTIRGRKKEMLVTVTGKNIAPSAIEGAIKSASPLIDHVVAIAEGRRYVSALIALDSRALQAFTDTDAELTGSEFARLSRSPEVHEAVAAAVDAGNASLSSVERVRGFHIADHQWQAGGDEVTATSKLRRESINAKYVQEIEGLYA